MPDRRPVISRRKLLAAASLATAGCGKVAPGPQTPSKAHRFSEKLLEDMGAAMRAPLSYLGDRLGILKAMASSGPVTSAELARVTGLHPRYMRAWLEAMTTAEYIEYHPSDKKFLLPPEHAAILADEESPQFMGGGLQGMVPSVLVTPKLEDAFRTGKGLAYSDFIPEAYESMARWSAPGFKHQLVQKWIPAMPDVNSRLREGGNAADVGCGQGLASIMLAKGFPQSRFWGYDVYAPSIESARTRAAAAGVGDRVTFEVVDGAELPARKFDLITTFDVLHDSANPEAIVRSARAALAPEGTYLVSEPSLSPKLEENINPMGRMFYAAALIYCMSVSLGQGGPGIGSDVNPAIVEQWGKAAGFHRIRELPVDGGAFLEMRI